MTNKLEKLIETLLAKGIHISGVELAKSGGLAYQVSGFYKSGTVTVYQIGETLYADSRYNEVDPLDEFDADPFESLVNLNYQWWTRSKDRFEGWASPDASWAPHLVDLGLVKRKEELVVTYS
jgi:hypothetical protein